jgi:uncharacterized protein YjbI with pentapeptide repeats
LEIGLSALELGANLADADLDYSNLLAATFTGAHLSGAHFANAYANISSVAGKLPGGPDFSGADLAGAKGLRTGSLRKSASLCSPPLLAANGNGRPERGHPHARALAE